MLAFLTMRLGTLVRNTTLMSKPQLQVCKQQQTASGNKTCKLTFLPITWFSDNETWYTGSYIIFISWQNHNYKFVNNNREPQAIKLVYAYNFVVLVFLTMRLGTLAHNITLMSKPHLQVCKQPQALKTCLTL